MDRQNEREVVEFIQKENNYINISFIEDWGISLTALKKIDRVKKKEIAMVLLFTIFWDQNNQHLQTPNDGLCYELGSSYSFVFQISLLINLQLWVLPRFEKLWVLEFYLW